MADNSYDVIVIGAGFAGLTAARDLRQKGYGALVVEARDRIGGRSWYRPFADTEKSVEMGGGWADPDHSVALMREIDRYSIPLAPSPVERTEVTILSGERLLGPCPVPADQSAQLQRILDSLRDAAARIDCSRPIDAQGLEDLDVSTSEFLAQLSIPSAIRDIAGGWSRLNSGALEEDVSALHFLDWVAQFENDATTLAALPTHAFAEGTASLLDALLADGDPEIAYESPVALLRQTSTGVEVVTEGGDTHAAAAAIFAIPVNCWGDVEFDPPLSPDKTEIAKLGHAGTSVKVWALAEGLPEDALAGIGERTAPIDVLSAEYRLPAGDLVVGFTTRDRGIDTSDRAAVERALQAFVPEARVTKVDSHDWTADRYSKGTWFAGKPGYLSRYASAADATEGRVFFAGSDVSHVFRGWMTGAVGSGVIAAERLAKAVGDGR